MSSADHTGDADHTIWAFRFCSSQCAPPGSTLSDNTWSNMVETTHRRAMLEEMHGLRRGRSGYVHSDARPWFVEERPGFVITWDMDLGVQNDVVRMVRLDIFNPRRSLRQQRRSRVTLAARRFLRPLGTVRGTGLLGAVGAGSAALINMILGDPVGLILVLLAGAVTGAGAGYELFLRRPPRHWRTIDLLRREGPTRRLATIEPGLCETILDAHRMAVLQASAPDPDPETVEALGSVRWLAWELAGVVQHDGGDARGELDDALGQLDDAAVVLRDRLAAREPARIAAERERLFSGATDDRNVFDTESERLVGDARSRARRARTAEGAAAAAEYARMSAADLAHPPRGE